MISIIIPVFNEEANIEKKLWQLQADSEIEVIVVDGGSQDQTVKLAQQFAVKVVISPQAGRASQMNLGAAVATGEILLFLHVDTDLPQHYQQEIQKILANPLIVLGAFRLGIDSSQFAYRILETFVNWRSRFLSFPYGDQAFFIRASMFEEMGGFLTLPIMEDFELIQRLKRRGKIAIASSKVLTSARRWQKLGILKTTLINQLMIIGYYGKVSPEKLANWYGKKSSFSKNIGKQD